VGGGEAKGQRKRGAAAGGQQLGAGEAVGQRKRGGRQPSPPRGELVGRDRGEWWFAVPVVAVCVFAYAWANQCLHFLILWACCRYAAQGPCVLWWCVCSPDRT
jgi:hypothetical protein